MGESYGLLDAGCLTLPPPVILGRGPLGARAAAATWGGGFAEAGTARGSCLGSIPVAEVLGVAGAKASAGRGVGDVDADTAAGSAATVGIAVIDPVAVAGALGGAPPLP